MTNQTEKLPLLPRDGVDGMNLFMQPARKSRARRVLNWFRQLPYLPHVERRPGFVPFLLLGVVAGLLAILIAILNGWPASLFLLAYTVGGTAAMLLAVLVYAALPYKEEE